MNQTKGLPVRLAILIFVVPFLYLSALGIMFNWPTGYGDPELPNSWLPTIFYCVALTSGLVGAVLFALNRIRSGLVLLAISTVLTVTGILL